MTLAVTDTKDGISASGIAASATVGPWTILGGRYMLGVDDTGTAGGTLEILMPSGNYLAVGASTTLSAAGTAVVDLPACTLKWIAGGSITLGSLFFQRVPYLPSM